MSLIKRSLSVFPVVLAVKDRSLKDDLAQIKFQRLLMLKQSLLQLTIVLIFVCEIAAQNPRPPDWYFETNKERDDFSKMTRQGVERRQGIIIIKSNIKLSKKEKQRLEPLAEDFAAYSEFLKQPKTGLVKILDSVNCQNENKAPMIVSAPRCGGDLALYVGSGFSFRAGDHSYAGNADLSLKEGFFVSRGVRVQTMMFNMGNFPLENVLPTSKSFITLNEFVCPTKIEELALEFENLQKGLRVGNFYFKNIMPANVNSTYILRSTAFKMSLPIAKENKHLIIKEDDRDDVIVALRVVRKDSDGSITMLWKELSRKEAPEAIYPEIN